MKSYDKPALPEYLAHYGILGMHWGIRRTPEELGHLTRADAKWVRKNSDKITKEAKRRSQADLNRYSAELMKLPGAINRSGKVSAATINAYNRKMAELMGKQVSDLRSPSGQVVRFVAKRGELGVFMALASAGYDMNKLRNGVYGSGRVAYKKDVLDKVDR